MSKPFIIGVCEHEIVDALRRVDVIDTWAEAFTPEGFVDAIESKAVPLGAEHTIILISDAHAKADYHPMINAYPGQIVAIPWEYEPPSTCPVVALPVTVNSILKALSLVVQSDLGLAAHGDEPIFVRGLQEHGVRNDKFPSIVSDLVAPTSSGDISLGDIPSKTDASESAMSARKKLEALLAKSRTQVAPPEFYMPYDQVSKDNSEVTPTPTPTPVPTSTSTPTPTPIVTPTPTPMPVSTPMPVGEPATEPSVTAAQAMWKKSQFNIPIATLATFWSSKGGVGKSTFALSSAIWLATHSSLRVCIIDLDIEGDIANRLHMSKRDTLSLTDILAGTIDAATLTDTVPIATVGRNRSPLYVIRAPSSRHGLNASMLMSPQNYRRLLDVAKKVYNVIIIDAPAGLGMSAVSQFAIPSADRLVAVIDNEISAVSQFITELKILISDPYYINPDKIGIVLNQVVGTGVGRSSIETTLNKMKGLESGKRFRIIASADDQREAVVRSYQKGAPMAEGDSDLAGSAQAVAEFIVDPSWLALSSETDTGATKASRRSRSRQSESLLKKYLPHVYSMINKD